MGLFSQQHFSLRAKTEIYEQLGLAGELAGNRHGEPGVGAGPTNSVKEGPDELDDFCLDGLRVLIGAPPGETSTGIG